MSTIVKQYNQSLLDVSIQSTGTVETCILIALHNDISVTDDLAIGSKTNIPELEKNTDVFNYYERHNIKPATACNGIVFNESPHYAVPEYVQENYWV